MERHILLMFEIGNIKNEKLKDQLEGTRKENEHLLSI